MIPPFDPHGYLPDGIHPCSAEDLLDRFGTGSPRREWLGERLKALLDVARASGRVRVVYIFGSFVSAKEAPRDVDLLLVVARGLEDSDLAGPLRPLLDHEQARLLFNADVFWIPEEVGENVLMDLLEAYRFGRDLKRRGIAEVQP